jgi:hypothetical protein
MLFTRREKSTTLENSEEKTLLYETITTGVTRKNFSKMRTSHKMYLTFILSSVCIFMYQYHVSIPRAFSQQSIIEVSMTFYYTVVRIIIAQLYFNETEIIHKFFFFLQLATKNEIYIFNFLVSVVKN